MTSQVRVFPKLASADWREHEEFFSKKISVFGKTRTEKDIL